MNSAQVGGRCARVGPRPQRAPPAPEHATALLREVKPPRFILHLCNYWGFYSFQALRMKHFEIIFTSTTGIPNS